MYSSCAEHCMWPKQSRHNNTFSGGEEEGKRGKDNNGMCRMHDCTHFHSFDSMAYFRMNILALFPSRSSSPPTKCINGICHSLHSSCFMLIWVSCIADCLSVVFCETMRQINRLIFKRTDTNYWNGMNLSLTLHHQIAVAAAAAQSSRRTYVLFISVIHSMLFLHFDSEWRLLSPHKWPTQAPKETLWHAEWILISYRSNCNMNSNEISLRMFDWPTTIPGMLSRILFTSLKMYRPSERTHANYSIPMRSNSELCRS